MSTRVNMHNSYLNPRGALSSRADTLPEGPRCPLLPSQRSDPVSSEGSARAQLEVGQQLIIFPKTPPLHSAREKSAPPRAAQRTASSLLHKGRRGQTPSGTARFTAPL